MADVIGPTNKLPGARHKLPEGATCDTHNDRPAVARIQGETDSFGAELFDVCAECLAQYEAEVKAEREEPKHCDWCHHMKLRVSPRRDFEEGSAGPVYQVCGDCWSKRNASLVEEDNADSFDNYQDYLHEVASERDDEF